MHLKALANGATCANGANDLEESAVLLAEVRDITQTQRWKRTEEFFTRVHAPSFGQLSDASDLAISPDGKKLAFTGQVWNSLQGTPGTEVYLVDLLSNTEPSENPSPVPITRGSRNNQKPKWSPDGKSLVFMSDRDRIGQHQLFHLTCNQLGDAQPLTSASLEGIVEDFAWSHDSKSILIGVAGYGLPKSGFEGSGTLLNEEDKGPAWMPTLKTDHPTTNVRSLWLHDLESSQTRRISLPGRNVWRFAWCGPQDAIAIVSDRPAEGAYQESALTKISIQDGSEQLIMADSNKYLLTEPTASPSGLKIAVIESLGGDRSKLAGDIVCVDIKTNDQRRITIDVDITSIEWTGEETLLAMGLRGLSAVALEVNASTQEVRELWSTGNACGPSYPQPAALNGGGFVIVRRGWQLAPEIGLVGSQGIYHKILSFDNDGRRWLRTQIGQSQEVSWKAKDGLEIQGFLYLPTQGKKPYPLVLNVHGGPNSAFVDQWMGYRAWVAFLVAHGYAVLNPNPRGSVGRGRQFTAGVSGDVGGSDAWDLLSGVDHLVNMGVADKSRLGVIGGSYGGYQSAWLPTITDRFAAAIPISPINDWNLQWLSSDLHQRILDIRPYDKESLAFHRSPLQQVHRCKTPTLQLVGAMDQCTPPPQAHYYHVALLEHGVKSCIVEYPQEGHGVRQFPTMIDACCRMFSWFNHYMPVD